MKKKNKIKKPEKSARYYNFPHKEFQRQEFLQIRWKNDADYLDDIIKVTDFSKKWIEHFSQHDLVDRRGQNRTSCNFRITVKDKFAILDYSNLPHNKNVLNRKNKISPGKLTINFTDDTRSVVKEISWKDDKGKLESECGVTSWDLIPYNKFKMPKNSAVKHVKVSRKERFNQTRFKASLLEIYGQKCSISGCSIIAVLEAAHIMLAGDENSYDIRNGLLLRADLHKLFDAGCLRINPKTQKIILSPNLRNDSTYGRFHGKPLMKPLSRYPGPEKSVLDQKWRMLEPFRKR